MTVGRVAGALYGPLGCAEITRTPRHVGDGSVRTGGEARKYGADPSPPNVCLFVPRRAEMAWVPPTERRFCREMKGTGDEDRTHQRRNARGVLRRAAG